MLEAESTVTANSRLSDSRQAHTLTHSRTQRRNCDDSNNNNNSDHDNNYDRRLQTAMLAFNIAPIRICERKQHYVNCLARARELKLKCPTSELESWRAGAQKHKLKELKPEARTASLQKGP